MLKLIKHFRLQAGREAVANNPILSFEIICARVASDKERERELELEFILLQLDAS